jgi:hypothetical protein
MQMCCIIPRMPPQAAKISNAILLADFFSTFKRDKNNRTMTNSNLTCVFLWRIYFYYYTQSHWPRILLPVKNNRRCSPANKGRFPLTRQIRNCRCCHGRWILNVTCIADCWMSVADSEIRWRSYPVETDFSYENRHFLMLHISKTSFCVSVWWIWSTSSMTLPAVPFT